MRQVRDYSRDEKKDHAKKDKDKQGKRVHGCFPRTSMLVSHAFLIMDWSRVMPRRIEPGRDRVRITASMNAGGVLATGD